LAEAIAAAGGTPLVFPLLEISPASDPQAAAAAAAAHIVDYAMAIFISPNAVDYALPSILANGPWPAGLCPGNALGRERSRRWLAHGIPAACANRALRFETLAQPARTGGRTVRQADRHFPW
jgi:uroporphyrinogen-III synthase